MFDLEWIAGIMFCTIHLDLMGLQLIQMTKILALKKISSSNWQVGMRIDSWHSCI